MKTPHTSTKADRPGRQTAKPARRSLGNSQRILCALAFTLLLNLRAHAAPFGWGYNVHSEIGDGTTNDRTNATAVTTSGALSGKTLTGISSSMAGFAVSTHTLVVSSDGHVFAWGDNSYGQLGDGTTSTTSSPVAVDMSGVLSGKRVVAVAAGVTFSLALTSSGHLYSWGYNISGQLGDGTTDYSHVPVAVNMTGVLAGKVVTAICAGESSACVLASDGSVFTWGYGGSGRLGRGSLADSSVPVAVDTSGVLSGKIVTSISLSQAHCLAVTTTGEVVGWGRNSDGQIGDGLGGANRLSPSPVHAAGVLSGKTIVAVSAGYYHSLALSSDGLVYAWGIGSLGSSTSSFSPVPVETYMAGVLSGKSVVAVAAGGAHSLALTTDGELFAWGSNASGELGDGTTTSHNLPVAVHMAGALAGMAATSVSAGYVTSFCLASPVSTTITPASRYNYAANFGWLNWRWSASASDAPVINNDFLAGRVYSANVGWIDLGNGTPTGASGHYAQTSGDIGVNNDGAGNLSGYAYAANIGWIDFDQTIAAASRPRVDIVTGAFSGYAYSANCGWIELAGIKSTIKPGADTPLSPGGAGNGIADSWEKERAVASGMGETLGHLANTPGADYDHDGVSDADEYLADTNPFDANDKLKVTSFNYNPLTHEATLDWNGSNRRAFTLLYSYDLTHWTADATTAPGSGANLIMTGQPSPQLFFKVRAQLPLAPSGDPGI